MPAAPHTPLAATKPGNPMLEAPLDELPVEWREHARELRRENANLRALARAAEEKAAQEKIAADAKAAAAEETRALLQKEREASNRRLINAEVRSAATALGLQDTDTLKLLDTSTLTINDDTGAVAGVAELLAEFKKSKPFLFKDSLVNTTQSRKTPDKSGAKPFDARTATAGERATDAKARGLQLKQH
jgi:hypothetical protein